MHIDYESHPVLAVDDERANLVTIRYCLEEEFTVIETTSPTEALRILESREVAVLLADQRMPEMSGAELAARARALRPDVVRMIVTAFSDTSAVIEAINRGQVTRYITKPWRVDELRAVVRTGIEIYHLNGMVRGLEAKMLQADRQATVQVMVHRFAHEVAKPLNVMAANVERVIRGLRELRQRCPAGETQVIIDNIEHTLDEVRSGARHLSAITKEARAGDKRGEALPGKDLRKVIEAAVSIVRAEILKKARLEILGAESPLVMADPTQVGQIVINILTNACEAIERGGREDNHIEIRIGRSGARAWFEVQDTGCGIPPDRLESVFDPFYSTKNGDNSGLGLSIAREILDAVGGRISVESEQGRGSTFRVELPAAEES